jgi:hypothetical protein
MSDKSTQELLAQGFWRTALYRGILKFGIPGVLLLTVLGLIWNGDQTFEMAWWREGSVGFLLGGFIWGAALWLIARSPLLVRETLNWSLMLAILVSGGIYLFAKLDWISALTILVVVVLYLSVLFLRENTRQEPGNSRPSNN